MMTRLTGAASLTQITRGSGSDEQPHVRWQAFYEKLKPHFASFVESTVILEGCNTGTETPVMWLC